jgi:glycyl-radical enzyme activating protein family protein
MKDKGLVFNIQKFSIHDGPGIRSVVFFKGCPLKCFWCANPESQLKKPEEMWDNSLKRPTTVGKYMTVEEIMEEVLKDVMFYEESGGGVTLSGGEVLYQVDFAIELLKALQLRGIHTCVETTGVCNPKKFQEFIKHVDMIYMDYKHYDSQAHLRGTGGRNEIVKQNIQYAIHHHQNVVIRIPIIPSFNDSLEDAQHFADDFHEMGINKIELLPFHQYGENKYKFLNRDYVLKDIPQLHTEDLDEHKKIMEKNGIACLVR